MLPRLLDAFCCAGGASRGYQLAGFHVTGVDIDPQPNYCGDEFVQGDAVAYIAEHGHEYDFIHASPPCQAYTLCQRIRGNTHPDLVAPTREALNATGRPWVVENVLGAPLLHPELLCGAMFGLETYRERIFECGGGFVFAAPPHPPHRWPVTKMGRPPQPGQFMHIVGNFSGAQRAREILGTPWMTRDEMREAIPPVYTQFIGEYALA